MLSNNHQRALNTLTNHQSHPAPITASPWRGRYRTFEECIQRPKLNWIDPFPDEPSEDRWVPGKNGVTNEETEYRLGKELWYPGLGYIYREALSCRKIGLNARMRASVQYYNEFMNGRAKPRVYITEQVTPMYDFLKRHIPLLEGSEYLEDVPTGWYQRGIRCEDITKLSFADGTFDTVLSFDVLEHVPDYHAAISEICRILTPGGDLLLTVPIAPDAFQSHRRARIDENNQVEFILEPEYHGNPLGPPSLCFTSFGFDLIDDIKRCGFSDCYVEAYGGREMGYWGPEQFLIVAKK